MPKKQLIVLSSITYAYKARDFLYNKGIKCYVERIPANLRKSGCGYCIRLNGGTNSIDVNSVAKMLTEKGIRVKDVIEL